MNHSSQSTHVTNGSKLRCYQHTQVQLECHAFLFRKWLVKNTFFKSFPKKKLRLSISKMWIWIFPKQLHPRSGGIKIHVRQILIQSQCHSVKISVNFGQKDSLLKLKRILKNIMKFPQDIYANRQLIKLDMPLVWHEESFISQWHVKIYQETFKK